MNLLDDHLLGAHRRSALIEAGVSDHELRGPLWLHPGRDRYVWAAADGTHPRHRAHAAAARLPAGGAVTGWAAAWLHGATDLDGLLLGHTERMLPVPVCTTPGHRLTPSSDPAGALLVSRSRLNRDEIVEVDGVSCASLVRTAFDSARFAPDLVEAVTTLDALLRSTGLQREDVAAYAADHPRWHGRRRVLEACALATPWSLSCPESRLRVLWITRAGLPEPQVNRVVLDRGGRTVAMPDLLDEQAWLVVEYDGAYHSAADQRARDDERTQRLHELGLHVVRVGAWDLHPARRARTVARLSALHHARSRARRGQTPTWTLAPRPVQRRPAPPPS